jgi:hypothetical protein
MPTDRAALFIAIHGGGLRFISAALAGGRVVRSHGGRSGGAPARGVRPGGEQYGGCLHPNRGMTSLRSSAPRSATGGPAPASPSRRARCPSRWLLAIASVRSVCSRKLIDGLKLRCPRTLAAALRPRAVVRRSAGDATGGACKPRRHSLWSARRPRSFAVRRSRRSRKTALRRSCGIVDDEDMSAISNDSRRPNEGRPGNFASHRTPGNESHDRDINSRRRAGRRSARPRPVRFEPDADSSDMTTSLARRRPGGPAQASPVMRATASHQPRMARKRPHGWRMNTPMKEPSYAGVRLHPQAWIGRGLRCRPERERVSSGVKTATSTQSLRRPRSPGDPPPSGT